MHSLINNIQQVFGVSESPMAISDWLVQLRISHGRLLGQPKQLTSINKGYEQPFNVLIVDEAKKLLTHKVDSKTVVFVCDALSVLQNCSLGLITQPTIEGVREALVYSLHNPLPSDFVFRINQPSEHEEILKATKASFLNDLQSLLYTISPYDLRKATQQAVVTYLYGNLSKTALVSKLKVSHKLDKMLGIMTSDKAGKLREAIGVYNKTLDMKLAMSMGFESFEILYVVNSMKKNG